MAAFRHELAACSRQQLAGIDPAELAAEYAEKLELEAPFSAVPAEAASLLRG